MELDRFVDGVNANPHLTRLALSARIPGSESPAASPCGCRASDAGGVGENPGGVSRQLLVRVVAGPQTPVVSARMAVAVGSSSTPREQRDDAHDYYQLSLPSAGGTPREQRDDPGVSVRYRHRLWEASCPG
jgi:hypothetical protein